VRWRLAVSGFVLAFIAFTAFSRLVGNPLLIPGWHTMPVVAGCVGMLLGVTRLRPLLWAAAGLVVAGWLIVGHTPLIAGPVQSLVRRDTLTPVEACVVLSSDIQMDGDLTELALQRFTHAYSVLQQGQARRLVLTNLGSRRSYGPTIREHCRKLGFEFPIEETGKVRNTHDEALAVSELCRQRGWDTVVLVSDPTHMRRAAGTFEKAGVRVLCSPCPEATYDLENLGRREKVYDRLEAFRDWVHEVIGYEVYRMRGWI